MDYEKQQQKKSSFREGMTLDEYLSSMKTIGELENQIEDTVEENLYETSKNTKDKQIFTYQIREIDQDNYDDSLEIIEKMIKNKTPLEFHPQPPNMKVTNRNVSTNFQISNGSLPKQNNQQRARRQSNSPFKHAVRQVLNFSPNKLFSQTLHAQNPQNHWRIHRQPHPQPKSQTSSSTTLYGKFIKGIKTNEKQQTVKQTERQKYSKKKTQQGQQLMGSKNEKDILEKYEKHPISDFLSMRIDGVQDKLFERKFFPGIKKSK